jgi:hypothetical protein
MSTASELELSIVAHGDAVKTQAEMPLQNDRANRDQLRRTAHVLLCELDALDELNRLQD